MYCATQPWRPAASGPARPAARLRLTQPLRSAGVAAREPHERARIDRPRRHRDSSRERSLSKRGVRTRRMCTATRPALGRIGQWLDLDQVASDNLDPDGFRVPCRACRPMDRSQRQLSRVGRRRRATAARALAPVPARRRFVANFCADACAPHATDAVGCTSTPAHRHRRPPCRCPGASALPRPVASPRRPCQLLHVTACSARVGAFSPRRGGRFAMGEGLSTRAVAPFGPSTCKG